MNNKGVTLIELLIVIVVMGILAAVSTVSVSAVVENQREKVDQANAEYVGDTIEQAYLDGNIIIKNGKLYNTLSRRSYSGTGNSFYEDFDGYIKNVISPQSSELQNQYNYARATGSYKFLFSVSGRDVTIFCYDQNKTKVEFHTFTLEQ